MFVAHDRMLDRLRAERMLDAAEVAAVSQMGKAASGWFDRMLAAARGAAVEVVRRAFPLFTWNGQGVNTSQGLRQKFAEGVSGSRVES